MVGKLSEVKSSIVRRESSMALNKSSSILRSCPLSLNGSVPGEMAERFGGSALEGEVGVPP